MTAFAITTKDNPFDPFDQFDEWFRFDLDKQYNSCSLLARFLNSSKDTNKYEENRMIEEAIDTIIRSDPLDLYRKVSKEVSDSDNESVSESTYQPIFIKE